MTASPGAITAASATIGPIFPPSIPAVIYAMLTGASVGALFMAGMMPGVILAICLCIYIAFISKKRKYPKSVPPQLGAYLRYCFKAIWALLTPVILLVGIYTGVMTPTEAGAIAGAYALLIAVLVYHILNWEGLKQVIFDTVKGTGSVSIMVGGGLRHLLYLRQGADRRPPGQLDHLLYRQQVCLPHHGEHHHPGAGHVRGHLRHPAGHDPHPGGPWPSSST